MAAAIYAGRSQRDTLVVEKGGYGGRVKDTGEIRNYPGTISDSGQGLMEKFHLHAQSYPTVEFCRSTVTGIRKEKGLFTVDTKRRGSFTARSVILALGTKPRELGIPGEKEFVGHGVATAQPAMRNFSKEKISMSWAPETRRWRKPITSQASPPKSQLSYCMKKAIWIAMRFQLSGLTKIRRLNSSGAPQCRKSKARTMWKRWS